MQTKWLTYTLLALAAALAALLLMRSVAPTPQFGEALDAPRPLPALSLLDDQGQPAQLSDSRGRLRLVFYGFVRCPDVCPATMTVLKEAYAGLTPEQQQKVLVQLISVDPQFDKPNVLREYLDRFNPDFTGLTGDEGTVHQAAREMFVGIQGSADAGAHAGHTAASSAPAASQPAALLHGDQVSVVTPAGEMVRIYGNSAVISGELTRDLPALIRTYGP
ncbi:SCO family protein [Deinococcus lacus]|uniref:SCO family protein n=1 Tax=Deinococcus lacus TaxID=392561 RepID=A0ABW1YBE0_9DEIO